MQRVLVIGLGLSGQAAIKFLLQKGANVVGVDRNPTLLQSEVFEEGKKLGLTLMHESALQELSSFDQVVISPGVPPTDRLYLMALQQKIEVIGEAELALRECRQPCIAITGTNGKTTVTLLTEHILKKSGKKARALGNVGDPLASYFIAPDLEEILVIELSSYQLETMHTRIFDVGVILNITPDHLDRYPSMLEYAAAKLRLQDCMKPKAPLYVHESVRQFGQERAGQWRIFGKDSSSFFWTDKEKAHHAEMIEYFLPVSYRNCGIHESENALAAWALCREFNVSKEQFIEGLRTFKKPAHRIELVKNIAGVSYYDDSKGTNIDAVIQAVQAMPGPSLLIAGGVDKGASYQLWKGPFADKVKKIFAIGKAADKICLELQDSFLVEKVASLEEAVARAAQDAKKGDCVLLSPGCASYDMFRDYAHRGDEFKKYVNYIEEKKS